MEKINTRIFLILSLFIVGLFLHNAWVQENSQPLAKSDSPSADAQALPSNDSAVSAMSDLPAVPNQSESAGHTAPEVPVTAVTSIPAERKINVSTNVFKATLDKQGGDIVYLELSKYLQDLDNPDEGYTLMDRSNERFYVAESGLLNDAGPDSRKQGTRATYRATAQQYVMGDDSELVVPMFYTTANGVQIEKRYTFHKSSYLVDVDYIINNKSNDVYQASSYGRLKRNKPVSKSSMFGAMRTYTGGAVYTPEKPFTKLSFDDMSKKPFRESIEGGWIGLVEHYFVSSWIPEKDEKNYYQTNVVGDDKYAVQYVSNPTSVAPGESKMISGQLYAGPETTDVLKTISKGLELTVDYGILWPICQPIFWLLDLLHQFLGNWGWAIVGTTVVIKLLFYKLSASAYRSMGRMRKLQPRLEALKEKCGDDKQKFGQEMMALYRKEKVNPLGGCLPILLQIPVFIALYWVLLESVELRHAPFLLWIQDLSSKDPFYVLPILMGASMLIQQKLSPTPPDPIQAKVMMFMPVFFTVLFLQFPSGLVLYWFVNNVLSILQQWFITKQLDKSTA